MDYGYLITKVKEEMNSNDVDISLAFLNFVFPFIESTDKELMTECNEEIPAKNVKVTGYFINVDESLINIYLVDFDEFASNIQDISIDKYNRNRDCLINIMKMINDNSYMDINECSRIYDLCDYITSHKNYEIVLNIVTNYKLTPECENEGNYTLGNWKYGVRTYDINSILDKINADSMYSNVLDIKTKFGKGVPAVLISSQKDVDVYLTYFIGEWLAQLYKEDSVGLLSANVRSYLKRTNKVNREIINTVKETPEEFVAYNNGLSAIATKVNLSNFDKTFAVIESLENFLIVNGGQTTATLFECKNDKLNLDDIIVPAKISVIKNSNAAEDLISNISIYSNAQTAIKKSDPPSNLKFYKMFEELSKRIMAQKNMVEYHCFFERTNGQYNTLKKMNAKSGSFSLLNPEKNKFTKLQLAQAIVAWEGNPELVCKGQEKNFEYFNSVVKVISTKNVDENYFKGSYALILIYRQFDRIIKKFKLPYKSSLIAYSLAYLSLASDKKIDLIDIWNNQCVEKNLSDSMEKIVLDVYDKMIDSPEKYPDIRMWSRKVECWEHIKKIEEKYSFPNCDTRWDFFPENHAVYFIDEHFLDVSMWKDVEKWVREENIQLSQNQIRMLHGMPALIYKGKISKRQESFAKSIFLNVVEEGYRYEE